MTLDDFQPLLVLVLSFATSYCLTRAIDRVGISIKVRESRHWLTGELVRERWYVGPIIGFEWPPVRVPRAVAVRLLRLMGAEL